MPAGPKENGAEAGMGETSAVRESRERHRRPTLDTVARALGVSRATVSNAYNRPDQLSAALRERVLATAAELGYGGPDAAARGLRRGRVGAIAVLLSERLSYAFSDPAGVLFLDGLAAAVESDGFGLLLLPGVDGGGPSATVVSGAVVDGFVAYSLADDDPAFEAIRRRGQPLVVVDQPQRAPADDVALVGVDDGSGAEAAAAHLIGLGHRRLGLICFELAPDRRGGPVDAARRAGARFAVTRARLDGYAHGLAGAADVEVAIEETAHNSQGDGQAAALALLRRGERPTGLLAMSDELALGALAAAAECGLSVPGDVSVVGFDDTPAAGRATPPLTTVAQPLRPKGELAGDALLALLDGRPVQPAALPTRLVVRASTGPPPRPRNAAVTWERVRPPARSARRRSG